MYYIETSYILYSIDYHCDIGFTKFIGYTKMFYWVKFVDNEKKCLSSLIFLSFENYDKI